MKLRIGERKNRKRMAVLAVSAIALAISPLPALAEATLVRQPVTFTLTPACPNLQVTVVGSGESFIVINSRIDQNGFTHVDINTLATGAATDSDGVSYGFNYHNHASLDIPPGGFPFQVTTTDHFNLEGKGRANQIHVGFVARLTFTSPSDFTFELVNIRGNPLFCDGL